MLANMRRVFFVMLFSVVAGAGSLAWAEHGHGGGQGHGGGHGWSGGHGFSGGHGHVSYGHFGGDSGFNNYWGGGGSHFYTGHHNYGWPYYSYYRPYANYYRPYSYNYSYFGYPYLYGYYGYPSSYYYGYPTYYYSYPSDYYAYGNNYGYGNTYLNTLPSREYVVSRPVADVARLEVRLPDPQATIWVEGTQMTSGGTVRQFRSPPLDPSQEYTYTIRAEWNENGKLITEERQVIVQANELAVVDFTQPTGAAPAGGPALPDLPPPQPRPTSP